MSQNVPDDLLYTEEHEWVRREGDAATVGITDHAQEALGDVTFVEMPAPGAAVTKGGEACAIESAKAAASIYAPADGKIVAGNEEVEADPALVNSDPYGAGWIYKMELADAAQLDALMTPEQYRRFLQQEQA